MNKNKIKNFLIVVFVGTTIIAASLGAFFSLKNTQNYDGYIKESDLLKKYHNEDLQILNKSIFKNKTNARIMDTNTKMNKIAESIVDKNSLKRELNLELPNISKNSQYIISAEPLNPWNDGDKKTLENEKTQEKIYKSSIKVSIAIKTKFSQKELISNPIFSNIKYLKDDEISIFLNSFKDQETSQKIDEVSFYLTHQAKLDASNKNEIQTLESIELHDVSPLISQIYNFPTNPKKIKYKITYSSIDSDNSNKISYNVHSEISNSVLGAEFNSEEFSITYSCKK